MKHYLNVCDVDGSKVAPVDIITFGSPCQDLSVAGKRAGLKHESKGDEETTRSGLFMEAVRIIKEMRESTNGQYPRFALWENVPGAFSSNKGEDFRVVLEELAKVADKTVSIPKPPKGKWTTAGYMDGDGWSLAWRTVDAQYHGVPQRRRRILLVADFGGQRAGEILFKCEGLRGYPPQSGETREGVAADAPGSSGGKDNGRVVIALDREASNAGYDFDRAPGIREDGIAQTIKATGPGSVCYAETVCYDARGNGNGSTVPTITGDHENRITDYTALAVEPKAYGFSAGQSSKAGSIAFDEEISPTLRGGASGTNQVPTVFIEPKAYGLDRASFNQGVNAKYDFSILPEKQPTMTAKGLCAICVRHIVRRLTPTECARLQGFPDDWGRISPKPDMTAAEVDFWNDVYVTHQRIVNGKEVQPKTKAQLLTWYNKLHNDGNEYKMWGNGVALHCVRVPIHGMAKLGAKTLASLFDGSGGFPLAGTLEGIDPVWCSEIEPYPIAVTVERFPENVDDSWMY